MVPSLLAVAGQGLHTAAKQLRHEIQNKLLCSRPSRESDQEWLLETKNYSLRNRRWGTALELQWAKAMHLDIFAHPYLPPSAIHSRGIVQANLNGKFKAIFFMHSIRAMSCQW